MERKTYRWCAVYQCRNTSISTPNKLFIDVPRKLDMRKKWLSLARRKYDKLSVSSPIYFCEDHFDLPNDMENYMRYHIMGFVKKILIKPGCLPSKFLYQTDTKKSFPLSRPAAVKRKRLAVKEEAVEEFKFECNIENTTLPLDSQRRLHSTFSNTNATQPAAMDKSKQKGIKKQTLYQQNSLCTTCLSINRSLCDVNTVVEMETLFPDLKFGQNDRICWECKAMAKKWMAFRNRTYKAQSLLQDVTKNNKSNTLQSLSILKPVGPFCMSYDNDPLILEDAVKKELVKDDYGNFGIFVKDETIDSEELNEETDTCEEHHLVEAGQSVVEDASSTDAVANIPIKVGKHAYGPTDEHSTYNEEECKIKSEILSDSDIDIESNVGNKKSDKNRLKREGTLNVKYKERIFIRLKMTKEEMNNTRELDRTVQSYVSFTYKCQSCILGYYTIEKYLRHMEEKHSEKAGQYKCPVCEVHYSTKRSVTRHYARHFNSYKCKKCDFTNHRLPTMLKHMKNLHEPVKKNECNTCGMSFGSIRAMRYHHNKTHKEFPTSLN